jgi:anti-anti-sigma factor
MTPTIPRLAAHTAGDTTVVRFTGRQVALHDDTVAALSGPLLALADGPGRGTLVLDLGNVNFVSSRVLGALIALRLRLQESGRRLSLCNLSPAVYEVFDLMKLTVLLDVRPRGRDGGPAGAGVLVVDDEAAVRAVLGAGLGWHGFTVWLAATGQEALDLYREHRAGIGLVLLDVQMAGLSGPETFAALQRLDPGARCCFMSGDPWPHTEEGLLQLGAVRFFHKPLVLEEVAEALRLVLACPAAPA